MSVNRKELGHTLRRFIQYSLGTALILSVIFNEPEGPLDKWGIAREAGRLIVGLILTNWALVKEVATVSTELIKRNKE